MLNNSRMLWPIYFSALGLLGTTSFRFTCQTQPYYLWIDLVIVGLMLLLLFHLNRRQTSQKGRLPLHIQLLIGAIVVWPFVSQQITRLFGIGDPWEIILLCFLQNAALCCAVLGNRVRLGQFAVVFSAFQLLFVGFLFVSTEMTIILVLFGVAILWWMMEEYWSRTAGALPVAERRVIPFRRSLISGTSVLLAVIMLLGGALLPGRPLLRLAGFMPTSGGDRWGDKFARDGSGNGEALTGAVKNATTIAPVDTDVYVSSEQPSLYDMISKAYGKPSKQKDKKITIDGTKFDNIQHEKNQELMASRQFSTIRNYSEVAKDQSRRKSSALLFVSGDVPLHLRMETFTEFDGQDWTRGEGGPQYEFELSPKGDSTWFHSRRPLLSNIFTAHHFHDLQFVNLKSPRIPTPSLLCTWHVPQVDRHDFFEWTSDDVLLMKGREQVPPTTKIGICSHGVNLYELFQHQSWTANTLRPTTAPSYLDLIPESIRRLPKGWMQIAALEDHFRREFVHDPTQTVSNEDQDSVRAFLTSGRGPDYLFASAAAVVLRELGYQTRFVQGLLAHPKDYDRNSKLTIIWEDGLHSWLEICVDEHNWIPLETVPGYPLPQRDLTWKQSILLWLQLTQHWLIVNWTACLAGLFAVAAIFWKRAWVFDRMSGLAWFSLQWLNPATSFWLCEQIVRRRLWLGGIPCPHTRSLKYWLQVHSLETSEANLGAGPFLELRDRARYSPSKSILNIDRSVARAASLNALRAIRSESIRQNVRARNRQRIGSSALSVNPA